jgi:hypothetical protein
MKDTGMLGERPAKSNVPTAPALGIKIVPRFNAPGFTEVPCCENPPTADATVTEIGSARAVAGTSPAKTNATQTALILAPFSLEYTFLQTRCPEVRENFPHAPNFRCIARASSKEVSTGSPAI